MNNEKHEVLYRQLHSELEVEKDLNFNTYEDLNKESTKVLDNLNLFEARD